MTLSTINTVRFKPLIIWVNAGYGTRVKIPTPQLRLGVINRALSFTYGKGTWGGGAYYLWGACCMRGNTVLEFHDVNHLYLSVGFIYCASEHCRWNGPNIKYPIMFIGSLWQLLKVVCLIDVCAASILIHDSVNSFSLKIFFPIFLLFYIHATCIFFKMYLQVSIVN